MINNAIQNPKSAPFIAVFIPKRTTTVTSSFFGAPSTLTIPTSFRLLQLGLLAFISTFPRPMQLTPSINTILTIPNSIHPVYHMILHFQFDFQSSIRYSDWTSLTPHESPWDSRVECWNLKPNVNLKEELLNYWSWIQYPWWDDLVRSTIYCFEFRVCWVDYDSVETAMVISF